MKLVNVLEHILVSLGCTIEEDLVYLTLGDNKQAIHITYKHPKLGKIKAKLALPTKGILALEEDPYLVKFLPTGENVLKGRSEVLNMLIKLMTVKLDTTIYKLVSGIYDLLTSKKASDLTNQQLMLVGAIDTSKITDKGINWTYASLHNLIEPSNVSRMTQFKYESAKEIDGIKYNRICTIRPIVLDELDRASKDTKRIKYIPKTFTKTMLHTLTTLFQAVCGDNDTVGVSSSFSIPYLESTLLAYIQYASRLNAIMLAFGDLFTEDDYIDIEWRSHVKSLITMHNKEHLVTLPGNEGVALDDTPGQATRVPATPAPTPKVVKQERIVPTPTLDEDEEEEEPYSSSSGLDALIASNSKHNKAVPDPVPPAYPPQGYPPGYPQYPYPQQYPPVQQPYTPQYPPVQQPYTPSYPYPQQPYPYPQPNYPQERSGGSLEDRLNSIDEGRKAVEAQARAYGYPYYPR